MKNFFGNIDEQDIESMHILGNSWIVGFFIIGACLLAASFLVAWQVRRVQRMIASSRAEEVKSEHSPTSPQPLKTEGEDDQSQI
ncbi:MAG TPA: hypothetical protein VEK34_02295 [Methylocella sp.]|nr:hypothetical protein [Methylocella sp.]